MTIELGGVKLVDRPRMFRVIHRVVLKKLSTKLWVCGPRGDVGGYQWPETRRRVRLLARQMAREEMKAARRKALPI